MRDRPGETIGIYSLGWRGPWVRAIPDLPPGVRVHEVVFDYPWAEIVELTIEAPDGFGPAEPPDPVEITSPYGRYRLQFEPAEDGLKVNRAFALFQATVPAAEYGDLRAFLQQAREADKGMIDFERVLDR